MKKLNDNMMMVKIHVRKIFCRLELLLAVSLLLFSCFKEAETIPSDPVAEGLPSTISLSVQLPDMTPVSRVAGIMPDADEASKVNDLWIGIFNAVTGERSGAVTKVYNEVWADGSHNNTGHKVVKLDNVRSGKSYIVAVANASVNNGTVTVSNTLYIGGEDAYGKQYDMAVLLDAAETWEQYKSIAALLLDDAQNIQHSGADFLMSGIYYDGHPSHSGKIYAEQDVNEDGDIKSPVAIYPGNNDLDGCIQLRRVSAYVKFNLQVAEAYRNMITFTPVSWQVFNMPSLSYVHERGKGINGEGINAADLGVDVKGIFGDNYSTYNSSFIQEFSSFDPIREDATVIGYSFDFYQMENKHVAVGAVRDYVDREREFKTEDGVNTGWYKSLVDTPGDIVPAVPDYGDRSNNNASFVVIRARLEYWYDPNTNDRTPVDPPADPDQTSFVHRVGNAIYTIHLGYCEDENGNTALADFNCRRNTMYTYNVTLYGVDNISVEAQSHEEIPAEPESGAEGLVTDVIRDVIDLDSHYGVFNIQLTDRDRVENFIWRIQAPFDGRYIDMLCGPDEAFAVSQIIYLDPRTSGTEKGAKYDALSTNQFYNWIQIRPTSGEKVLAHYPGDPRLRNRKIRNDDDADGQGETYYPVEDIPDYAHVEDGEVVGSDGVWYLETLRDVVNFPHPGITDSGYLKYLRKKQNGEPTSSDEDNDYNLQFNTLRWYTVFIDEYAYLYDYDGEDPDFTKSNYISGSWSDDQKEQMPITAGWKKFVNQDNRKAWIALSNRHVSNDLESIFSNAAYYVSQESIQTYYSNVAETAIGIESTNESYIDEVFEENPYNEGRYDNTDGLLNTYYYVVNPPNGRGKGIGGRLRWDDVWTTENGSDPYNHPDDGWTAHSPKEAILRNGPVIIDEHHTFPIPAHRNHYMDPCLARNRDLNNDGFIGANEIRWYLPTDGVYTRMVLGAPSLRSPLFQLNLYTRDQVKAGVGDGYTHYVASNARFMWAEELAAMSGLSENWVTKEMKPKTLRCVRNLGQYMNLKPTEGEGSDGYAKIDAAYEVDPDAHTVTMRFYRTNALRGYTESYLPLHDISSILSYASRKFRYAKEDCGSDNLDSVSSVIVSNFSLSGKYYSSNRMTHNAWGDILLTNAMCGQYYEEGDRSDVGKWRVPNITELGILRLLAESYPNYPDMIQYQNGNEARNYVSASREYFDGRANSPGQRVYMGIFLKNISARDGTEIGSAFVRCVRDVE